jgi:hypothetical protein
MVAPLIHNGATFLQNPGRKQNSNLKTKKTKNWRKKTEEFDLLIVLYPFLPPLTFLNLV